MFHLARRLFGYVASRAPTHDELDAVRTQLSPELFDLFVTMNHQDQRHGIQVATRVSDTDLTEAALLHDVGKAVAPLGAIGRSVANHYHLWVDACLGEGKTTAGFDYAGPLTEVLLLGVVANRFPTQRLDYDAAKLAITNFDAANKLMRRQYREGWEVEGL